MLAAGGLITGAESVLVYSLAKFHYAGVYYLAQRECGPGTLYYRAVASSVSLRFI